MIPLPTHFPAHKNKYDYDVLMLFEKAFYRHHSEQEGEGVGIDEGIRFVPTDYAQKHHERGAEESRSSPSEGYERRSRESVKKHYPHQHCRCCHNLACAQRHVVSNKTTSIPSRRHLVSLTAPLFLGFAVAPTCPFAFPERQPEGCLTDTRGIIIIITGSVNTNKNSSKNSF